MTNNYCYIDIKGIGMRPVYSPSIFKKTLLGLVLSASLAGCSTHEQVQKSEQLYLVEDVTMPMAGDVRYEMVKTNILFIDARKKSNAIIFQDADAIRKDIVEGDYLADSIFEQFQIKLEKQGVQVLNVDYDVKMPIYSELTDSDEYNLLIVTLNDLHVDVFNGASSSADTTFEMSLKGWGIRSERNNNNGFFKKYKSDVKSETSETKLTVMDANQLLNRTVNESINEILQDVALVEYMNAQSDVI